MRHNALVKTGLLPTDTIESLQKELPEIRSHITDEERAAAIDEDLKQGIGIEEVFKENIATYPCGDRLKSSNQHARLDALVKTGLLPTDTIESLRKEIPKMKSITTIKDRAAAIDADLRQGKSIEDVFKVHIATNPGGGRRSRPQQVDRINAMEKKKLLSTGTIKSLRDALSEILRNAPKKAPQGCLLPPLRGRFLISIYGCAYF